MINHIFKKTAKENRAALVVFISCGDPDIGFTEKLVRRVCDAGADMVELGVPFSDPMADGKSIQAASRRAAIKIRFFVCFMTMSNCWLVSTAKLCCARHPRVIQNTGRLHISTDPVVARVKTHPDLLTL